MVSGKALWVGRLGFLVVWVAYAPQAWALAGHRTYSYDRPEYRDTKVAVHYGDSIVAGWCGFNCSIKSYADYYTYLNRESASSELRANIDGYIQGMSGDMASQIADEVDRTSKLLQTADIITVEACGNDYLTARREFKNPKSANYCRTAPLWKAYSDCQAGIRRIMDSFQKTAKPGAVIRAMTIYYPGVDDDRSMTCPYMNRRFEPVGRSAYDIFVEFLARGNYMTCETARQKGFGCVDVFAEFNGSELPAREGGKFKDRLRWIPGESEDSYLSRVLANRADVFDARKKPLADGTTADLLQGDNTHPNERGHRLIGSLHHQLGYQQSK